MEYIIISIVVLIISIFLFNKCAGSLSPYKPNMVSFIFFFYVICETYLSSILIVTGFDNHYVIRNVDETSKLIGWLTIQYLMVSFPFGILLARYLLSPNASSYKMLIRYERSAVSSVSLFGAASKYALVLLTMISIYAAIYVFYYIGYIPVLKILEISPDDVLYVRIDSSRQFDGSIYLRNLVGIKLMPICAYAWIAHYLRKRSFFNGLMSLVSFAFAVNVLLFDISKQPILLFIIGILFLLYYSGVRIKTGYLILFVMMTFVILFVMYSVYGVDDFMQLSGGPVGRILFGQSAGLYYMYNIFPDIHNYIGWSSISRLISDFLGIEYMDRAARIAMKHFNPMGIEQGKAGVMNTIFLGEAWANFGWVGVLFSPLYVGFFVGMLYVAFLKMPKHPFIIAVFAHLSVSIPITGGFNDFIYPMWLIVCVIYIIILYILSGIIAAPFYRRLSSQTVQG